VFYLPIATSFVAFFEIGPVKGACRKSSATSL
jgi:hypothetical protein